MSLPCFILILLTVGSQAEPKRIFKVGERLEALSVVDDDIVVMQPPAHGPLKLWDLKRERLLKELDWRKGDKTYDREFGSFAVAPNGEILVGAGRRAIGIWNIKGGRLRYCWTAHDEGFVTVATDARGRRIISGGIDIPERGGRDCVIKIWSPDGRKLYKRISLASMKGGDAEISIAGVAASADGTEIVAVTTDGRVHRLQVDYKAHEIDGGVREKSWQLIEPRWGNDPVVSASDVLAVTFAELSNTKVVMLATRETCYFLAGKEFSEDVFAIPFDELIHGIVMNSQATRVVLLTSERRAQIWDIRQVRGRDEDEVTIVDTLEQPAGFTCLNFSPDGETLFAGTLNGLIEVWPLQPMEPLAEP